MRRCHFNESFVSLDLPKVLAALHEADTIFEQLREQPAKVCKPEPLGLCIWVCECLCMYVCVYTCVCVCASIIIY